MRDSVTETFHRKNEQHQNAQFAKVLTISIFFGPALILCKYLNIFYNMRYDYLILFTLYLLVSMLLFRLLCKRHPYGKLNKYVALSLSEILIILISLNRGFSVFISYVFIPLASCLYFNRKFTLKVTIACYIAMFASIFYRAMFIVPQYENSLDPVQWAVSYLSGTTAEFAFVTVFITQIIRKNSSVLNTNLASIHTLLNTQIALSESYSALIIQTHSNMRLHVKFSTAYVKIICVKLKETHSFEKLESTEFINSVVTASPLHDIGYIILFDTLFNRKEPFSPDEQKLFERHTEYGERIVRENMDLMENSEYLHIACNMILYHHERYDGKGYPASLAGDDIPLCARIMAAANALDTLIMQNLCGAKDFAADVDATQVILHLRTSNAVAAVDAALASMDTLAGTELDPVIAALIPSMRNAILAALTQQVLD